MWEQCIELITSITLLDDTQFIEPSSLAELYSVLTEKKTMTNNINQQIASEKIYFCHECSSIDSKLEGQLSTAVRNRDYISCSSTPSFWSCEQVPPSREIVNIPDVRHNPGPSPHKQPPLNDVIVLPPHEVNVEVAGPLTISVITHRYVESYNLWELCSFFCKDRSRRRRNSISLGDQQRITGKTYTTASQSQRYLSTYQMEHYPTT